jgi:GTP-binding protein HflX
MKTTAQNDLTDVFLRESIVKENDGSGARCLVIHPRIRSLGRDPGRPPESSLLEAVGLAKAIDLEVVEAQVISISRVSPSTLFGRGTVERLGAVISSTPKGAEKPHSEDDVVTASEKRRFHRKHVAKAMAIDLVVVDATLTSIQQRNLEREWTCKVIDRTGLILEIFGARARTREGRLQVELAAITYARSRLVRSWTHLERQRGGLGFVGGPGETQIESDRRLISERIIRIKRQLEGVKRTRGLHRQARRRVPYPIIALVGYTNAGKSTLFNTLTAAESIARDQLFATLDPAMRGTDLPSGRSAILSDTVGFISNLPHELVAAFKATLEEVLEADVIVHVRDSAHPDTDAQRQDVLSVLSNLGVNDAVGHNVVEVLNKIDQLDPETRAFSAKRAARNNEQPMVLVSALTGEGCDGLLAVLDAHLTKGWQVLDITVSSQDGRKLAWLYSHGDVVERQDCDEGIRLKVRLDDIDVARLAILNTPQASPT